MSTRDGGYATLADDEPSLNHTTTKHHHSSAPQPAPRWGNHTSNGRGNDGGADASSTGATVAAAGGLKQFRWGRDGATATADSAAPTRLRLHAEDDHEHSAPPAAAAAPPSSTTAPVAPTLSATSRPHHHRGNRRRRSNSAVGGRPPSADDTSVDGFVQPVVGVMSSSSKVLEAGLLDHEESSAAIGAAAPAGGRSRARTTVVAAPASGSGEAAGGYAWQRPRSKSAGPSASPERDDDGFGDDDGIAPQRVRRLVATPNGAADSAKKKEISLDNVKKGAWSVACEVLNLFPAAVAEKLVKSVDEEDWYRLQELEIALVKPYRREEPTHFALIPALWEAMMGVVPTLPAAGLMDTSSFRSELWKEYGFQGTDPGTDFRGAGLLGLRSLIWVCTEEPELIREMITSEYPFAIAVINLVMSVMEMLQLTQNKATCLSTKMNKPNYTTLESKKRLITMIVTWRNSPCPALPPPPRGASLGPDSIAQLEDGFCAAVSLFCRILHGEWQRSPRNVLDFNGVMKVARHKFESVFRDKETYDRIVVTLESRYPELPPISAGL